MANRLVEYMQDVIPAIFQDIKYLYPNLKEWNRDLTRLLFQLDVRGPALLTDDMPSVSKHLNQCLDVGKYSNPHMVLSRPKRSSEEIPLFMGQIFKLVFHPNGEILEKPCENAVLALKTVFQTWKSIKLPCKQEIIENEVSNFFSMDAHLDPPTLGWSDDDLGPSLHHGGSAIPLRISDGRSQDRESGTVSNNGVTITNWEARNIERTFDVIASSLGLAPHMQCGTQSSSDHTPRHGPGVVANLPKGKSKYSFPYWSDKLQRLFPRDYYALPSFGGGFSGDRDDFEYSSLEYPSRVIAVPKTLRKPRLIAAEPVEHQWIQQLLWRSMEEQIAKGPLRDSLTFRSQEPNQLLAIRGSIDGSYTTMDLSEASDRLTCYTVERFFRANVSWLEALHACRTRRASYDLGAYGVFTQTLNKFASMGSTCTFPVQSLVFATIAISAALCSAGQRPTLARIYGFNRKVRVFGDDIIVSKDISDTTIRFLTFLGLKINSAKTFTGKNFRESCGVDAFRGVDVTPPKMLEIPNGRLGTLSSLVETSNNWYYAGYWHTSNRILAYVKRWQHLLPIGPSPDFAHTIASVCGWKVDHLSTRYNKQLHRREMRVLTTRPTLQRHDMSGSQRLLQYFTEKPSPFTKWESGTLESVVTVTRPGWTPIYTSQNKKLARV